MIQWKEFKHCLGGIAKVPGAGYVSYVFTPKGWVVTIFGKRFDPVDCSSVEDCRRFIIGRGIQQLRRALGNLNEEAKNYAAKASE